MKNFIQEKFVFFLTLWLLVSQPVAAQFDEPDNDEDSSESEINPAPIDDYILPFLIMGMATGYYLIRKKQQSIGTN